MKKSIKTGLTFGLTSGIITTLGLMMGLYSGTSSRIAVVGGILTIAIADSLSDALGIHVAEESYKGNLPSEVWEATLSTFAAKFVFTLTFVIPTALLNLQSAILINIAWGLLLLSLLSFYIAKIQNESPLHTVLEHLLIATLVLVATNFLGGQLARIFP